MSLKDRIVRKLAFKYVIGKLKTMQIEGVNMRWDKLLQGAAMSGLLTVAVAAAPFFSDGKISSAEGMMLLGTFLGGVGLYIKQHPPVE